MRSSVAGIKTDIRVCIPALDEAEWLPKTLHSLALQTNTQFQVYICVNQPDAWWNMPEKAEICDNNAKTLDWIAANSHTFPFSVEVIDRSSPGKGWKKGEGGAGAARKALMDYALRNSGDDVILISADADTTFDTEYVESVANLFHANPAAIALAAPYYHPLSGDDAADRAMLRYELFMRFYLMNLIRIRSPFAFTAIGSALAITGKGYKSTGGMPQKPVGEDFYLLQKAAKRSKVLTALPCSVYPAARLSQRVGYGTGPAILEGMAGVSERYRFIHPKHFDTLRDLYDLFPELYQKNLHTSADLFLQSVFGELPWNTLRRNAASERTFVKACHQKIDGLRIWQWMRREAAADDPEDALRANVQVFLEGSELPKDCFEESPAGTKMLSGLRDLVWRKELEMRRYHDETL